MLSSEVLLSVIAVSTSIIALRSLRRSKMSQKKHFLARIEQTDRGIWDLEFSRKQKKEIREGIRQQYDRVSERLLQVRAALELEEKREEPKVEAINNLKSTIDGMDSDCQQMRKQLEALDNEIEGEENPDSVQNKIEAARALKEMIGNHVKTL